MAHSLPRLLHSTLANLRLHKLSYAFLVTVCRFKVSGLALKMATGCAVGRKCRWDMTPTASVKLTATNPAEESCELR
jgi:hypothetical protein